MNLIQILNTNLAKRIYVAISSLIFLYLFEQNLQEQMISLLYLTCIILYSELLINTYNSYCSIIKKNIIFIFGCFYLLYGTIALQEILESNYIWQFLFSVFIIDTTSYICGNIIKGKKLAPQISPNKHISGAICGLIFGAIACKILVIDTLNISRGMTQDIILSIIFAIITQLGDLLVSYAKRILSIKDSSSLLGSHGGFWDRFDSIFASAIFTYFLMYLK